MTVYYVAKTGDDGNAGTTLGAPKLTIANACAVADGGAGNVVEIIDSGVYSEGDIAIYTNAITVRATGSNTPIMDGTSGNNDYAFTSNASGNVFQGLIMRNYDDGLVNSFGWPPNGYDFKLLGCTGHFIAGPQQIGAGGNAEVQNCKIVSDTRTTFTPYGNYKIWFNNSVIATNAEGYHCIDSAQSRTAVTASFCTFIGSGYGSGRNNNLVNQVYKVINCIVSGSGDGINANTSTYNLVNVSGDPFIAWSGDDYDGTARSANTGEITGDPKFTSGTLPAYDPTFPGVDFGKANTQNYSLLEGSPAIDAGTAYGGITTDIIGTARSSPDIGAYEVAAGGYANEVLGVESGDIGKVLDVETAEIEKVMGVE